MNSTRPVVSVREPASITLQFVIKNNLKYLELYNLYINFKVILRRPGGSLVDCHILVVSYGGNISYQELFQNEKILFPAKVNNHRIFKSRKYIQLKN